MDKLDFAAQKFIETKQNEDFTEIYKLLNSYLLSFIRQKVHDKDTAQEILSYTLEKIYLGLKNDKYVPQSNTRFKTWASACAKNAILYHFRQSSRTYCYEVIDENVSTTTGELIDYEYEQNITDKRVKAVIEAINELPEKNDLREIARSYYLEGEKLKDIGKRLGLSKKRKGNSGKYDNSKVKYRAIKIREYLSERVQI